MAKLISKSLLHTRQAGRKPKYPWNKWSDGQAWLLRRGQDYVSADISIRGSAYQYAQRHNMVAQTWMHEEGVVVQFTPVKKLKLGKKLPRR